MSPCPPTDSDNKPNQNLQFTFHTVHQTNKFIYIARYAHNGNSKSLHNVWETLNKDTAQNISKQIKNSNDTNSPEPREQLEKTKLEYYQIQINQNSNWY